MLRCRLVVVVGELLPWLTCGDTVDTTDDEGSAEERFAVSSLLNAPSSNSKSFSGAVDGVDEGTGDDGLLFLLLLLLLFEGVNLVAEDGLLFKEA